MTQAQPMRPFIIAPDGVAPDAVPAITLESGARIPCVGLGTFGSDNVSHEAIAAAVLGAAEVGYRHFDCAAVYGNELQVGQALQTIMAGGIPREDLWITSKLWNDQHAPEKVIPAFKKSLADLQLDYLDLYLIHWPFPNFHPPHCDVTSRSPDAKPYIHADYMKTWRQLEKLVELGLVKHIGTSNMTIPKLKLLLRDAAIKPACSEMELHPHFQQAELFKFTQDQGIATIGYCPLGSPGRPERDRTPDDTVDIEDPVIVAIAQAHGVHPALVCIKWAVQHGHIAIPMSAKRRNYLGNLKCVTEDPLSSDEMVAISKLDRNCRLVKGQVFLWRENQDWQDLWDVNGDITPA